MLVESARESGFGAPEASCHRAVSGRGHRVFRSRSTPLLRRIATNCVYRAQKTTPVDGRGHPESQVELVRGEAVHRLHAEPNACRPAAPAPSGPARPPAQPFRRFPAAARVTGPTHRLSRPRLLGSPGTAGPNGEWASRLAPADRAGPSRCDTGPTEHYGARARPEAYRRAKVAGRRWPTGDGTK